MNISNLIIRLQELADSSTDAFDLMVLAKAIEKAKVGAVRTVATYGDLPLLPLEEDGELFLVEAEESIYFNTLFTWNAIESFGGIAYGWGVNYGFIGDNTTVNKSSPVTVVGGITNWSQVSAGGGHSLGIADGIAYAWGGGNNNYPAADGMLGDGTVIAKSSPVTVVGGITNWSQVAAGGFHSHGIAGGVLYAWGYGTFLGDGTTVSKSSPVTVVGGITNWSQVSASSNRSHGIAGGVLYGWGGNTQGRLGDGTTVNKSSPVTVVGGITNWSSISNGYNHTAGVANGIAYAWGFNAGQLGDGTTVNRSSPVTVVGGITNWSQVSAASTHTLGIAGGIAYAWGTNTGAYGYGQLGDGTTVNRSSPVTVIGGITNWSQVDAGSAFSLGLTADGIAYAWGDNKYFGFIGLGNLGDGTEDSRSSPVTVAGGITKWTQVSAGDDTGYGINFSLAIRSV